MAWVPWHTLGQNHKKHSIALLGPFVSKKGPNRGIKFNLISLKKIQRGDPSMSKKFSSPFLLKFHVSVSKDKSILHAKFEQNQRQKFLYWVPLLKQRGPIELLNVFYDSGPVCGAAAVCAPLSRQVAITLLSSTQHC